MSQQLSPANPQDDLGHRSSADDDPHRGHTAAGAPPSDTTLRRLAPLAVGAVTAAATLAVTWWNPGDSDAPLCPSKFMFGVDCPICGTTRATAALARGEWGRALDHNVLWVGLVPVIVAAFVVWIASAVRDRPMPTVSLPRWLWIGFGVAFVAYGIARNLDVTAFTRWLGADAGAL